MHLKRSLTKGVLVLFVFCQRRESLLTYYLYCFVCVVNLIFFHLWSWSTLIPHLEYYKVKSADYFAFAVIHHYSTIYDKNVNQTDLYLKLRNCFSTSYLQNFMFWYLRGAFSLLGPPSTQSLVNLYADTSSNTATLTRSF